MKKTIAVLILLIGLVLFCACKMPSPAKSEDATTNAKQIVLSDEKITVDGTEIGNGFGTGVHTANDIIYYEAGKDFTYGEGSEQDAHEKAEAEAHTVLHITKAGAYRIKGKLTRGQIAVDLGEDAKDDPAAVVTLILDGVDITCTVAPAVIFYNVYECGEKNEEKATKDVDTSAAGANVILADGSTNHVNGSYVARIYKADSVVLNEDKTEVKDAKKLHKYDAAFYSKTSMNIGGEKEGSGILNIRAENEGLDSELHLTLNGGEINILSGNDGINTNEDGISVTTVNSGKINIRVTGETGEGDGIDSNGWLVINGGILTAEACSTSGDAGIDSDMGIFINGGTVVASGNMLDRIENGGQTYSVFNFAEKQKDGELIKLKNAEGYIAFEAKPENTYSILIISSPDLPEGTYTLWSGKTQLAGQKGGMHGGEKAPAGEKDDGQTPPEKPEGEKPDGEMPEGEKPSQEKIPSDKIEKPKEENPEGRFPFFEDGQMPDFGFPENIFPEDGFPNFEFPEENKPDGSFENVPKENPAAGEFSTEFVIQEGGNTFSGIKALTKDSQLPPDVEALKKTYPQFFGLSSANGFDVYIWEASVNHYLCYLTEKTENSAIDDSFIFTSGATIAEMRAILESYKIAKEKVTLRPINNGLSSTYREIDDDYREKVNQIFWN